MPTLLNWKGHKFLFYSKEPGEPPHLHILKDRCQMKVWLEPVREAKSVGFAAHEKTVILKQVERHKTEFLKAWHDYFGN